MRLWPPMWQLVHLLGLEMKFWVLVEWVITLVIDVMLFRPLVGSLVQS